MARNVGTYRAQGGHEFVCASTTGGALSPGKITLEAGSASIQWPTESLGSSQVGTNLINHGLSTLTATTTGPTYTMDDPEAAGMLKCIAVTANTSSGTANVNANSTGTSFSSSGDNQLQFNAIGDRVTLMSASTSAWVIVGNVGSVGTATQTT